MDGMAPKRQEVLDRESSVARKGRSRPGNLRDQMAVNEGQSMWPTPVGDDTGTRKKKYAQGGTPLSMAANMWPTPRVSGQEGYDTRAARKGHDTAMSYLESAVEYHEKQVKWPTPSSMPRGPHTGRDHDGLQTVSKTTGTKFGMTLETATKHWPTPSASEDAAGRPEGNMQKMLGNHPDVRGQGEGTLAPRWVTWLMGLPIGWVSLDPLPQEEYETWLHEMLSDTWWEEERGLPRVGPSQPNRVDQLKALGNGIVPLAATYFLSRFQIENS